MTKEETIHKAQSLLDEGYACSQSILLAFAEQFELDERTAKIISSTFGGGMGRMREKCGALTGGFMVLGLAFGNIDPNDMDRKLDSYQKVQYLNQAINDLHDTTTCAVLLERNATKEEVAERKHHAIICRKVIGDVAGILYDMLEAGINATPIKNS